MNMNVLLNISSFVIALTALLFTVWQTCITRKHNKISVKPHLTTWTNRNFKNKTYSVKLMNNGIGPALIKDFKIFVDKNIVSGDGTELIKKAIKLLFPDSRYKSHNAYMGVNFCFGAKESCEIVFIEFSPETLLTEEQIESAFERADIVVEYESFYGEAFKYDSREEKIKTLSVPLESK